MHSDSQARFEPRRTIAPMHHTDHSSSDARAGAVAHPTRTTPGDTGDKTVLDRLVMSWARDIRGLARCSTSASGPLRQGAPEDR